MKIGYKYFVIEQIYDTFDGYVYREDTIAGPFETEEEALEEKERLYDAEIVAGEEFTGSDPWEGRKLVVDFWL